MKRIISVVLLLAMLSAIFAGVGFAETGVTGESREFTDDTGRTVTVPAKIDRIAVSGPLTQIYVLPLCGEKMVGCANEFSYEAEKYISADILALPSLGQLYGGKGTMDLEALLAANPQIVVDVGEAKGSIADDLDALTLQTGIPFVHIDATVETSADAYRKLGGLTGDTEKAEALAVWCENCLETVDDIMKRVDGDGVRKSLLYCLGDKGINVLADKSYHAETLNVVADNAAKLDDVVSSGLGNEVDMEQIMLWNPDVVIFAPDSIYEEAKEDPIWNYLDAVKNGKVYETPFGPYGWLASPPSVQRYLGLVWLCALLYPDYCTYELEDVVTEYYELFYGYELSHEDYMELVKYAMP